MTALPLDRLIGLVRDCQRSGVARQVLLIRAERLPPGLSRPHHLRLAEDALLPLLQASRAMQFQLPGPQFAITWRGEAEQAVLEVVRRLEVLLEDAMSGAPSLNTLVSIFQLPHQSELLLDALRPNDPAAEAGTVMLPPLDAEGLAGLEASLAHADVARFARRRPVWRLGGLTADVAAASSIAWDRRVLSVRDIAAELLPEYDVCKDPWLFRRLTRTLDRRMLALLASPGELDGARSFALNLNVASLLSAEFLRFDRALPSILRGKVVIELMPADIMADTDAFVFARGFARARGYRLLLRHASPALIRLLALDQLDVDHVQLHWSPALADTQPEAVTAAAPGRLVLFHADTQAALVWGAEAGIRLFQGAAANNAGLGERSAAA